MSRAGATRLLNVQKRIAGKQHLAKVSPDSAIAICSCCVHHSLFSQKLHGRCVLRAHRRSSQCQSKSTCDLTRLPTSIITQNSASHGQRALAYKSGVQQSQRLQRYRRAVAIAASTDHRRCIKQCEQGIDLGAPLLQINPTSPGTTLAFLHNDISVGPACRRERYTPLQPDHAHPTARHRVGRRGHCG